MTFGDFETLKSKTDTTGHVKEDGLEQSDIEKIKGGAGDLIKKLFDHSSGIGEIVNYNSTNHLFDQEGISKIARLNPEGASTALLEMLKNPQATSVEIKALTADLVDKVSMGIDAMSMKKINPTLGFGGLSSEKRRALKIRIFEAREAIRDYILQDDPQISSVSDVVLSRALFNIKE